MKAQRDWETSGEFNRRLQTQRKHLLEAEIRNEEWQLQNASNRLAGLRVKLEELNRTNQPTGQFTTP